MTIHTCKTHGEVKHYLRKDTGTLRCSLCWMEYLTRIRIQAKQELVNELGGSCSRCGYNQCAWAMHFHHRDPSTKEGSVSRMIANKQLTKAKKEIEKCDLLCSNCHAELEFDKVRRTPDSNREGREPVVA
jgi:formate-dependent nitrite reductase cytochrome c552 subunit